jgi:endonuclease YncB( thermonuclease family)
MHIYMICMHSCILSRRMLGIDAPESRQMCTSAKGTPYACGLEAKTFMQVV